MQHKNYGPTPCQAGANCHWIQLICDSSQPAEALVASKRIHKFVNHKVLPSFGLMHAYELYLGEKPLFIPPARQKQELANSTSPGLH